MGGSGQTWEAQDGRWFWQGKGQEKGKGWGKGKGRGKGNSKVQGNHDHLKKKRAKEFDFGNTGPRLAQDEPIGSYYKDTVWEQPGEDDADDDAAVPEIFRFQGTEEPKTWKSQDHSDLLREP